jgi:tetratricopeptide (TPR) repeat protein
MALLSVAAPAFPATSTQTESSALVKRGYGQICLGLYKPAIEALTKAVSLDKSNRTAKRYLCYALLQTGDFNAAVGQLKFLSQNKQPEAIDFYLLGEGHLQMGWIDVAELDFRKALSLKPSMKAAQVGLIKVMVCNANYEDALKLCSTCIKELSLADTSNANEAQLSAYFKHLYGRIKAAQDNSPTFAPGGAPSEQEGPLPPIWKG